MIQIFLEFFENSQDPDQMPQNVASDLGLRCLPVTSLGVCSLQWVKIAVHVLHSFYFSLYAIRYPLYKHFYIVIHVWPKSVVHNTNSAGLD